MKISKIMFLAALLICLSVLACRDDEAAKISYTPPTAEAFNDLIQTALENRTQRFSENAQDGWLSIGTGSGGSVFFSGSLITNNTSRANGIVDVEFVEIYDKGSMLVTDKPTMARIDESETLLVSGGEFFIDVSQDGVPLTLEGSSVIVAPGILTGGVSDTMSLWNGVIDTTGSIVWQTPQAQVSILDTYYYNYFNSFGWINCDDFFDNPNPRTGLTVTVPDGYDGTNSRVHLSADGEAYALGRLRFDENAGLFGGTNIFPLGLECHLVFVTEDEGNWRYATKAVTLQEDDHIIFDFDETATATEEELSDIVNALP